jgi:hypothetical protein
MMKNYSDIMRLFKKSLILIFVLGNVNVISLFAQDKWSIGSSFQSSSGNYIYETNTNTYSWYSNLRLQQNRWNISVSFPVIAQNNDQVTGAGGMFLPSGNMHSDNAGNGSHHGGMMEDNEIFRNLDVGIGDLYLWNSYLLSNEYNERPAVYINAQLKIPTASTKKNYGTGEFDFGIGFTLRKTISSFFAVVDFGYLYFGDPEGFEFKNPLSFGAGIGRNFLQGKYSTLLLYQGYTKIFDEFQAPSQISLGINYRAHLNLVLSFIGASGLSETSPDFSLSSGFELYF